MTFIAILLIIAAVLLIALVMIQNPKGSGFNTAFGGAQAANQIFGSAKSGDILEKATWALAGVVTICCIVFVYMIK